MARPLRAGDLRNPARIERVSTTADEIGGQVEGWTTVIPVWWCSIDTPHGAERVAAMQTESRYTHIIRGRFVEGITDSMRIFNQGVVMNIKSVADPDGKRVQLEILAEEVR